MKESQKVLILINNNNFLRWCILNKADHHFQNMILSLKNLMYYQTGLIILIPNTHIMKVHY